MSKTSAQLDREIAEALTTRGPWTIVVKGLNERVSRCTGGGGKPIEFESKAEAEAVAAKWTAASTHNRYWIEPLDPKE